VTVPAKQSETSNERCEVISLTKFQSAPGRTQRTERSESSHLWFRNRNKSGSCEG